MLTNSIKQFLFQTAEKIKGMALSIYEQEMIKEAFLASGRDTCEEKSREALEKVMGCKSEEMDFDLKPEEKEGFSVYKRLFPVEKKVDNWVEEYLKEK